MPPTFSIIACVDANGGIGKDGKIPWVNRADMKWFRATTTSHIVIMGSKTYHSIGSPLANRINIVISSSMGGDNDGDGGGDNDGANDITSLTIVPDFDAALRSASAVNDLSPTPLSIFVIGGGAVYASAIAHPLCNGLIITHLPTAYECDVMFPQIPSDIFAVDTTGDKSRASPQISDLITIYKRVNESEFAYLNLLKRAIDAPLIPNRTGIPARGLFAEVLKYPLREFDADVVPVFTTKFVPFRVVYEELLWFLKGSTTTEYLVEKNVKIWDGNSTREFLDGAGLSDYRVGELGPIYGYQWRNFNAPYISGAYVSDISVDDVGVGGMGVPAPNYPDQIRDVIASIKSDPFSRRHVVSAWNPQQIDQMALPPCHVMFIFHVSADMKLNCHLTMRSCDLFLGHPFNVCGYALLTHMIAKICGMVAGELAITMVNAHVYESHTRACSEQITRPVLGYPRLQFSEKINSKPHLCVEDFESGDMSVVDYYHAPRITATMAV